MPEKKTTCFLNSGEGEDGSGWKKNDDTDISKLKS